MELIHIKKILNIIKIFLFQHPLYYFYYKKLSIKKNVVLLESAHGKIFGEHLFSILQELENDCLDLEVYVVAQDVRKTKKVLETYHLNRIRIVRRISRKYFNLLASAEYLLNDRTFCVSFIKKLGQKYINIWVEASATWIQEMENVTDVANIQRNFYLTDQIIVDHEHSANFLADALGLSGIYQGKIIIVPLSLDVNEAHIVCDYIFKGISHKLIKEFNLYNGKETVFILGGGFWDNGVTTALLNTFDNTDLDRRNYVVLLGQKQLKKEYEFRVKNLSDKIIFYPFPESLTAGMFDQFLYLAYMRFEWFDGRWIRQRVGSVVRNDYKRIVGDLKVNHFVHFTGFGNRYSELIKYAPDEVNTVIYVHTNMIAEYKAKKNFSKKIVFSAYEQVDKVVVVHCNLKEELIKAVPAIRDKLYVMNNFLGEGRIRELASANLLQTLADVEMEYGHKERLISDLYDQNISIFINIGRFDYQKGHDRLIEAFETIYRENNNIKLVIVAPHGPLRDKILTAVANSSASSSIYILGRMSNPYALLAKCNCFVLSSYYEGLGLVVYEALAVGISVVTVDLKETIGYLQNDEAIIVDSSVNGIAEGMREYLSGEHLNNEFDFSVLREKSRLEFEMLFS